VLLWSSLFYLGAIVAIVLSRVRLVEACASAAARLPFVGHRFRIDPLRTRQMGQAIGALMERPGELARVALLELSAQALLVSEIYWTIRSMGVATSFGSALFMEVMTRALTIVEFVGATEMGFAVVFTWIGLPAAIGFALSLVKTLRSLTAAAIAIGIAKLAARPNHEPVRAPRVPSVVLVEDAD
jgi:hypothetical protein